MMFQNSTIGKISLLLSLDILFAKSCSSMNEPLLSFSSSLLSPNEMALSGNEPPLVSALLNQRPLTTNSNKKRFRRARSAPLVVDAIAPQQASLPSLRRPESIFKKLHPSFRQVAVVLTVYLGLAILSFSLVRNQMKGTKTDKVLDAAYFCIVTMTTVGYGDLVPNSVASKLLACAFVFSGMALVGLILSKAADYLVEKQEFLLLRALRGPTDFTKELETNRVKYKCVVVIILLSVLMVLGVLFLYFVEEFNFLDAFYCVCTTITTLGYGDKSFSTKAGRIFAVFWILISTLCLAQLFLCIAELNTESKQKELVKWVITRKFTHLDLEAADLNANGSVDLAEFIIFKLKEMGKINQEDISLLMEEFEELDVDQTGTLSAADVILAQQSPETTR